MTIIDKLFTSFIANYNLCCISPSKATNLFSYSNANYKAKKQIIANFIISNNQLDIFNNCLYCEYNINLSDHKPILLITNLIYDSRDKYIDTLKDQKIEHITLIPNLEMKRRNK